MLHVLSGGIGAHHDDDDDATAGALAPSMKEGERQGVKRAVHISRWQHENLHSLEMTLIILLRGGTH